MLDLMASSGGAPVRVLDEKEKARLARVRQRGADAWSQLQRKAPEDPLGALAWAAGVMGPTPADPCPMRDLVQRARADGFAWREISAALGEGDTPADARRVRDRQAFWAASCS